ncbi:MAG: hypothetical protein H6709_07080 [Kofleriaceae bacterium]|nr:hypothetical protein [Myxococcales bacterium]MCB9560106.1 hypothetical protein [Kofleriaceae bacterium]MCB9571841.1 hypothetical protein [Kofleriaceae bacterium]
MPEADTCDQPGHDTVMLDDAGRARLVEATWGYAARRARIARGHEHRSRPRSVTPSVPTGVGGLVLALLKTISFPILMVPTAVLGSAAVVSSAIARRIVDTPLPEQPPELGPAFAAATVVGTRSLASPATDRTCAAWAFELWLTTRRRAHLMARDAWTSGIELRLDDGRVASLPAGPWRAGGAAPTVKAVSRARLGDHLAAIDPCHDSADPLAPLRHDEVREVLLQPGDRVELLGDWDSDASGEPPAVSAPAVSPYREPGAVVLRPRGWPALRRL